MIYIHMIYHDIISVCKSGSNHYTVAGPVLQHAPQRVASAQLLTVMRAAGDGRFEGPFQRH